jgi:hypothetical protein
MSHRYHFCIFGSFVSDLKHKRNFVLSSCPFGLRPLVATTAVAMARATTRRSLTPRRRGGLSSASGTARISMIPPLRVHGEVRVLPQIMWQVGPAMTYLIAPLPHTATPFEEKKDVASTNGLRAINGGAEFPKRYTNQRPRPLKAVYKRKPQHATFLCRPLKPAKEAKRSWSLTRRPRGVGGGHAQMQRLVCGDTNMD